MLVTPETKEVILNQIEYIKIPYNNYNNKNGNKYLSYLAEGIVSDGKGKYD